MRVGDGDLREVVGITSTGKYASLVESATGQAYVPLAQRAAPAAILVVSTAVDPDRLVGSVRRAVQTLDPDLPLYDVTTVAAAIRGGADKQRAAAATLAVFGALALLLTLVGIYGLTAHGVTLRTREIGIRMSLGARASDVLSLFVTGSLKRSVIGLVLGMAVSLALSKVLARFLFGLSPTDAMSFVEGGLMILGGVTLASAVPARRAATVDPMVALRTE